MFSHWKKVTTAVPIDMIMQLVYQVLPGGGDAMKQRGITKLRVIGQCPIFEGYSRILELCG